jgi:asparagine synthase (glutamine-hydrolysing)
MCGLAGAWHLAADLAADELRQRALDMGGPLHHRGPDDEGCWHDTDAGIALAHRRLAIIDLTPAGHQPMVSGDGRSVLAYNGEVYNHRQLRGELEAAGSRFRGDSDTEVVLEACARWGVVAASRRFVGMFAFALWDRRLRELTLVRDRLGIKPLYVGQVGQVVLFGSELSAFRAHPDFPADVDRAALSAYFRRACVPAPHTIYRGVRKVLPGTVVTIRADGSTSAQTYWSLEEVARAGIDGRNVPATDEAVIAEFTPLLETAVRDRMLADVPLGAFLSGGIDSSTVVALMQQASDRPVRTYSIGSRDAGYDEAPLAAAVARHLGTEHTEFYVQPADVLDVIPSLPTICDEPFADPTIIPTYLLAKLARHEVTVALSGDGGDEVFGGYTRHLLASSRMANALRLPLGARRLASRAVLGIQATSWDTASWLVPASRRPPRLGDQLHKAAGALAARDLDDLYAKLTSHWDAPDQLVLDATEASSWGADDRWIDDPMERMLYRDTLGYLPDDGLTKVDRATMAASLEGRVPLLDHRVVEFLWRLPPEFKVRAGRSKWLLRAVVEQHVPRALLDRPKQGFGIPLDDWLRGPLRPWAEDLLDAQRLRREGFLDPAPIRARWEEHLAGRRQWQYHLWNVLMWQAWLEGAGNQRAPSPARGGAGT